MTDETGARAKALMVDDPDGLDTICRRCREERESGERNNATCRLPWPDGTHRYYCVGHAVEVFRFGLDPEDLPDPPLAIECPGCKRVTLRDDTAINKVCRDCRGDVEEVVPEDELVEAANAVKRGEDTASPRSDPGGSTDETTTR